MIKYLIYVFCISFFLSCDNNEVEIINDKLEQEIKNLQNFIKNNPPCKYDYLVVRINNDKIYISNSIPINNKNYIGKCNVNESEVFFYSDIHYEKYIQLNTCFKKDFSIDSSYNNKCHPDMDLILIIDKYDPSKLTRYIPKVILQTQCH